MTKDEALEFLGGAGLTISPRELAQVLGGQPYSYNLSARQGKLGLPHVWRGQNLRIFTAPLIKILKGDAP